MPIGVDPEITASSTAIKINHAVGASYVSSFQVTPDETFNALNISCGISVGLDYSYIYLRNANGPINPTLIAVASSANIWITGFLVI
jgi:hypothetical protein